MTRKIFKNNQNGIALIEVLIALVVLSVGLLGVSGMLVQSIRFNFDSGVRTQAMFFASDMAERIRNNQSIANPMLYDGLTGTEADPNCIETPAGCDAANLKNHDGYVWGEDIRNSLPEGSGTVAVGVDPNVLVITVNWIEQDNNTASGVIQKNYVLEIVPNLAAPGPVGP